jgi:serine-type D-Ala-D-Ala carboxypeptidase (penicillin-binding protein 5/6)
MIKRIAAIAGLVLAFGAAAAVAIVIWVDPGGDGDTEASVHTATLTTASVAEAAPSGTATAPAQAVSPGAPGSPGVRTVSVDTSYLLEPAIHPLPVMPRLKHPPAAGVLFDVRSGEILWERHPDSPKPIASLTKMMTALIIAQQDRPSDRVMVSAKAAHTPGSATGLLPAGRYVPLEPLLKALIMISANDAAVALAEHDAGSVTGFVKEMNRRAAALGLACTHFSTPNGLKDRNNYSCPLDLAAMARADLANKRIAEIAQTDYARPSFPIKGHRLHLANNHYFLGHGLTGVPGARVTGLKTGFTDGAGRCYVTTARLGGHHLGVVLLDSPDPISQVPALLQAGFIAVGEMSPPPPKPRPPKKKG